jgi:cystathionine beta-lyase/cystathionine gamma-synthase
MPIYETVAFEFDTAEEAEEAFLGKQPRHTYTRITNPTVEHLEQKIRQITGSLAVVAVSSGMAAIANTILSIAQQGENIVTTKFVFGTPILYSSTRSTPGDSKRDTQTSPDWKRLNRRSMPRRGRSSSRPSRTPSLKWQISKALQPLPAGTRSS